MRYRDAGGRPAEDDGVAVLDSTGVRSSDGRGEGNALLLAVDGGLDAGNGVEIPNALASLASFCGGSGERGMKAESATIGKCTTAPWVLTFGIAGAVNGETYSVGLGG